MPQQIMKWCNGAIVKSYNGEMVKLWCDATINGEMVK